MPEVSDQIRAWADTRAVDEACEPVGADEILAGARVGGHRPSTRPPRRALVTSLVAAASIVVVAVVATVTLWPQDREQTQPSPAGNDTFMRQAGEPILAGLKVEPGSVLVGRPFPERWDTPTTTYWSALIEVTDDPQKVLATYVDQLEDLGLTHDQSMMDPTQPCYSYPSGALPGRVEWKCVVSMENPEAEPALRSASIELVSPAVGTDDFPTMLQIDLVIRKPGVPVTTTTMPDWVRYLESLPTSLPTNTRPTPPSAPPNAPASPGPTRIPITGEAIAPTWMDPGVGLRVAEGSELLAFPAPLDGGTQGWVTVARLTGDPKVVMDDLLHQNNREPVHEEQATIDGKTVYWGWWDSAGGPKVELTAMQDGSGTWLLRINVIND